MSHVEHVVRHRGDRRLCRVGLVGHRVGEEALDQDVHPGVEGRREQQPLAVARGAVHDAAHHRQEAEVGHVVGLVEHGDLDGVEVDVALAHEVLETAGARHDDVDTPAQGGDLRVLAHPAEDGLAAQAERPGQRDERRLDLRGQLAGRREDQGTRARGPALDGVLRQPREQRQQEGVGLAGAGPATAEDVAARHRVRQGRRLDGRGHRDAGGGKDIGQRSGHAKVGKSGVSRHRGTPKRKRLTNSEWWSFCPARAVTGRGA